MRLDLNVHTTTPRKLDAVDGDADGNRFYIISDKRSQSAKRFVGDPGQPALAAPAGPEWS